MQLYFRALKMIVAVVACVIVSSFLAAFAVPPLIPSLEGVVGRALSYELLLRVYLAVIVFITLWIGTAWVVMKRQTRDAHLILRWLWIVAAVLFAVFALDQKWTITEENSWIRYPTAAALSGAGAFLLLSLRGAPTLTIGATRQSLGIARLLRSARNDKKIVFLLLGAGLLFAAADEILSIHEALGGALEGAFRLPHVTTDLVTAAYGVIGLGVLIYAFRAVRALARSSPAVQQMLALYFAGILLFVFATGFDSVDGIIFSWVRRLTDALTLRGYEFSDAWFIIWKPKLFLNALEEVFELYAAALFFWGAWVVARRDRQNDSLSPWWPARRALGAPEPNGMLVEPRGGERARVRGAIAFGSSLIIFVIIFLTAATLRMPRNTPLQDGSSAVKIAGLKEGLFHADDLDFHPRWGVVVANESEPSRRGTHTAPGVFTYKDGVFARVPDPIHMLSDIDSAAASNKAIYASDGVDGKVFRYDGQWSVQLDGRAYGAPHPEAIAVHEGEIAAIDESVHGVLHFLEVHKKFPPGTKFFMPRYRPYFPSHPLFQKPEGIIWHKGLNQFLITDDTTGVIFRYTREKPLEIFADQSDGLRFPEDIAVGPNGEVIVTDNGAREIIVFDGAGTVLRRVRMRPLYRDLQGITVDNRGNLYFVTADAFASESFMPSVVWQIPNFF